jgi:hypothetical protein
MNHELELKVQAFLDGELDASQAGELEAQMRVLPQAGALLTELTNTRAALRGNEPEYTLPESGEFYWSKIERAIHRAERQPQPAPGPFPLLSAWWHRYWPQLSGAAAAAMLLTLALIRFGGINGATWEDIETPLNDTGTFTFRSEQQRMTLVWVSTSPSQSADEESESLN